MGIRISAENSLWMHDLHKKAWSGFCGQTLTHTYGEPMRDEAGHAVCYVHSYWAERAVPLPSKIKNLVEDLVLHGELTAVGRESILELLED